MTIDRIRYWQYCLSFFSLIVLLASLYFQYIKGMQPCALCLMQRVCIFLEIIFCFIAVGLNTIKGYRIITVLQMLVAVAGFYFANRQLWLQSLPPDQVPACLPGLDIVLQYFPWRDILYTLLWGSADCAEVSWQFLGLSMPAWAALYFISMFSAIIVSYINLQRVLK